jgi:hypothetical protein
MAGEVHRNGNQGVDMALDINGQQMVLYALVGDDEFGSGKVGLKQHIVNREKLCPLVVMDFDLHKIDRPDVWDSLNTQAARYNKKIRLCRFEMVEIIKETQVGE